MCGRARRTDPGSSLRGGTSCAGSKLLSHCANRRTTVSLVPLVEEQASASVACQRKNNAVSICTAPSRSANRVLASLSPLTWEHVNLTGDYLWEDKPAIDEKGFRAIPFAL